MWDENERFAGAVARAFTGLLAALGVVLAAASLATGVFQFFATHLVILGLLAAIALGYVLVIGGVGVVLLGLVGALRRCLRRAGGGDVPRGEPDELGPG